MRRSFAADALLGDPLDVGGVVDHGLPRQGSMREVEPGRDAHRAQQAQRVLVEASAGVAHGAHQPGLEVALSIGRIDQAAGGLGPASAPGDGVDGEVAPGQVLEDVLAEGDACRAGDGRRSDGRVGRWSSPGRAPGPCRSGSGSSMPGKIRRMRSGRASVAMSQSLTLQAQQGVAHAAAHEVGAVAGPPQRVQHGHGLGIDRERRRLGGRGHVQLIGAWGPGAQRLSVR